MGVEDVEIKPTLRQWNEVLAPLILHKVDKVLNVLKWHLNALSQHIGQVIVPPVELQQV